MVIRPGVRSMLLNYHSGLLISHFNGVPKRLKSATPKGMGTLGKDLPAGGECPRVGCSMQANEERSDECTPIRALPTEQNSADGLRDGPSLG